MHIYIYIYIYIYIKNLQKIPSRAGEARYAVSLAHSAHTNPATFYEVFVGGPHSFPDDLVR